jgi:hypothetical protein
MTHDPGGSGWHFLSQRTAPFWITLWLVLILLTVLAAGVGPSAIIEFLIGLGGGVAGRRG